MNYRVSLIALLLSVTNVFGCSSHLMSNSYTPKVPSWETISQLPPFMRGILSTQLFNATKYGFMGHSGIVRPLLTPGIITAAAKQLNPESLALCKKHEAAYRPGKNCVHHSGGENCNLNLVSRICNAIIAFDQANNWSLSEWASFQLNKEVICGRASSIQFLAYPFWHFIMIKMGCSLPENINREEPANRFGSESFQGGWKRLSAGKKIAAAQLIHLFTVLGRKLLHPCNYPKLYPTLNPPVETFGRDQEEPESTLLLCDWKHLF